MAEVRLEIELPHPRDRVWRALTDARLLSEWFVPTDLEAREGARFTLAAGTLGGFLGPVAGELTELAPEQRIVMLWQGEKLHTRVVWEIIESDRGCTLQVVQTGFIGAPAALRRRALRDTYGRLFAEQLPVVLDRLAAAPSAVLADSAAAAGAPVRPAAVPRQRRAPVNMAVGAWAAGRTLGGPVSDSGSADTALPSAGQPPDPVVPPPRRAGDPERVAAPGDARPAAAPGDRQSAGLRGGDEPAGARGGAEPATAAGQPERRWWPAWLDRLGTVPAWASTVALGAAAAALAVVVLAAVVYTPGSDVGGSGPGTGPEAERDAPGVALQPGGGISHTAPAESAGPASPGGQPDETPGPSSAPSPGGGGVPGTLPGVDSLPEGTAAPSPAEPSPGPVLTAQVVMSDVLLLGLGGRAVTVTVSNPGPGSVSGWEVAMDVGDQNVTKVSGADYERDGSQAIFTPAGAELAAGTSTQFSFELPGLLGASDPTGCTIDGNPCG